MKKKPIQILHNNIIFFFEKTNEFSLKMHLENIKKEKISRAIIIDDSSETIKFPCVNLKTKEIYIQETYLSHLWSFTYSIFVIYEEAIQKKLLNETFNGYINTTCPLLNRADKLLSWSMNLNKKYSEWNRTLPNPDIDYKNRNNETFYIEKINNLYQSSVAFLLYHEYAHLVNGHKSYHFGITDDNYEVNIEIEREADEYAFSMLINENDEKNKIEKGLAILIVFCSGLMLSDKSNLKQKKHPDIDQRLLTIMSKLNFEEEKNEFYLWYLGSYILNSFLYKEKIPHDITIANTAKDLFFELLDEIDTIKDI